MDKIIFLDFDGVLNTDYYQNYLCYQGLAYQDEYAAFFDPETTKQLKRIIDRIMGTVHSADPQKCYNSSKWRNNYTYFTIFTQNGPY